MNDFSIKFSELAFSKFILWGVLIFILFRVIRFMLLRSSWLALGKRNYERYLPLTELFVWMVFLFWTVSKSSINNQLLSFGGIVLMLYISFWISRFVFREFIAGVIFRFGGRFRINEMLKVGDYSGKIVEFRNQSIEIETDHGEIIFLPYSQMLEQVHSKTDNAETIRNYSFTLLAKKEKNIDGLRHDIKTAILQLPWASVRKDPQIIPIAENGDHYELKITVYSIEREYFHKIEKLVQDRFAVSA